MMRGALRSLFVGLAVLLALAACGDDGGGDKNLLENLPTADIPAFEPITAANAAQVAEWQVAVPATTDACGETDDVAWSADGTMLVLVARYKGVCLYHLGQLDEPLAVLGHKREVRGVAASSDGIMVASGTGNGPEYALRLWDLTKGKAIKKWDRKDMDVEDMAFSPDGTLLAAPWNDAVKVWDAKTGDARYELAHPRVQSLAFSADGSTLASGGYDNRVLLWDPATGELIRALEGDGTSVWGVALSPDASIVAVWGNGTSIRLWDAESGEVIGTLSGHRRDVRRAIFSPDGSLLFSGSDDNTIRLWDPLAGEELAVLEDAGTYIALNADGTILASTSDDEPVKLWAAPLAAD